MGGSLKLFKIWDIEVQVHWSFLLILIYGAIAFGTGAADFLTGALYGVLIILFLFVCVVLHELGHAVTAKHFKVNVPYITLLPIGGVAQLERMPRKPMQEFLIAIAGPLVNFVLFAILLPFAFLFTGMAIRNGTMSASVASIFSRMQTPSFSSLILYLTVTNLMLGIFNLLPAFPMDGGRILRALLAMAMPYVRATQIAVLVGRGMAVLFAIWGIVGGGIFLLLIAFFVYIGGRGELEAVESRFVLKDLKAGQALNPGAEELYTSEKVEKVVDLIMSTYQTDFPVFDLSHQFVGVMTRTRLVNALRGAGATSRIADVMLPADRVPVVSPDMILSDVWDHMIDERSRVVAVKENGRFLGLITMEDISEVIQVIGAAKERGEEALDLADAAETIRSDKDEQPRELV